MIYHADSVSQFHIFGVGLLSCPVLLYTHWGIFHEVISTIIDNVHENYLILDMNIKNVRVKIDSVYGPNANSPAFFTDVRRNLERGGGDFIIGGDMNTIMSSDGGGTIWTK